jgi:transposase
MRKRQASSDARERAIGSLQKGLLTREQIAKQFNIARSTLYRWYEQSNSKEGDERFKSAPGRGRKGVIGPKEAKKLLSILSRPASKYGFPDDLWNCPRIVVLLKQRLKLKLSRVQVWQFLVRVGLRYIQPEKRYRAADPARRDEWINNDLPEILTFAKKKRAVLYFEDESSLALQPSAGKTWAQKGTTPIIRVPEGRGSITLISALSPSGRLLFSLPPAKVNSETIINFLRQILNHHKKRHVVVIMDSAPSHTSKVTRKFIASQKRLHVFHLPPYCPDLNPDELVWNHLKHQKMKAHQATNKQHLRELAARNLRSIQKNRRMLKAFCRKTNVRLFS